LARHANVNFLRCWGGADAETPTFYNECDRLGLLVWQEFPLSSSGISNSPPTDPDYLTRLAAFAPAVVKARRNHPGLVLWGGGNELTEPGQGNLPLTFDNPFAQTLKEVISRYDPDRQFRPSSPFGPEFDADPEKGELWDAHGPWEYSQRQLGQQYWRFNSIKPLLHSEFGLPGEASLETQREYISASYRYPNRPNPVRRHHGGAWWDHHETVVKAFGPLEGAAEYVLGSQWLQAEGLRYAIEESRRRWPHTAGTFLWQLNEPWPQATGTSAVEYTGRPKLAYHAVRQAYSSRSATARYDSLTLIEGEPLRSEVWILNEGAEDSGQVAVSLTDLQGRPLCETQHHPFTLQVNLPLKLLDLELPLPENFQGIAVLTLALSPGNQRHYLFSNLPEAPLKPALAYPDLLRSMFEERSGE
jgi:beta-mannosidase